MAEMLTYAPDLRSITGGQGEYTMEFLRYEEVPAHLAQKIVQKHDGGGRSGQGREARRVATLATPWRARATSARNQVDISCDVCGRTLLRGERAESYLAGGERRQVCELCTVARAARGLDPRGRRRRAGAAHARATERRGRGFLEQLRARRERAPRGRRRGRRRGGGRGVPQQAARAARRERRRAAAPTRRAARATSARCRPTPSSRSSARSRSSTRPSTPARSAASPARSARRRSARVRSPDRPQRRRDRRRCGS